MTATLHPAAPAHLPSFITAPGETDALLVFLAISLTLTILAFGVMFFWLHSLPERMMHKATKWQFDLVAVLGLLSLFTHIHAFWVAALLLAVIKLPEFGLPDVSGPVGSIAASLEKIANREPVAVQAAASAPPAKKDTATPPEPAAAQKAAATPKTGKEA